MLTAEVPNVHGQPTVSAPEHSNNTRYDTDSIVTPEEPAAVVLVDIKDEYVERKPTTRTHDVVTNYVSVDIPNSTYTCSTPPSCSCCTLTYEACVQSASGQDCNPTINFNHKNDNCGKKRKKSRRAFLLGYQEFDEVSGYVGGILFSSVFLIYLIVIIFTTVGYLKGASLPIMLLGTVMNLILAHALLYLTTYMEDFHPDIYKTYLHIYCILLLYTLFLYHCAFKLLHNR